MEIKDRICMLLRKVREERPLIHHITNWVTIYDSASITRALGALPVMAHASEEVEEMVSHAGALVLNIGTLTQEIVEAMLIAGERANDLNIPVVLDAVGVGATNLRTRKAEEIIDSVRISVIKGNEGEIGVLAGGGGRVKGVESMGSSSDPIRMCRKFAGEVRSTVVITGGRDVVSDGKRTYVIKNGHSMMGRVVGTGCMASSIIGCFCAVESDPLLASVSALVCFGVAGELATKKSDGPASFKERLHDSIYSLEDEKIKRMARVERL